MYKFWFSKTKFQFFDDSHNKLMKKFWEAGITDSPVPTSKFRVYTRHFKDTTTTKKSFSGSAHKNIGFRSPTKQPQEMPYQYFSPVAKSKKNKASKPKNLFPSPNNPHNRSINIIPENFFFLGFPKRKASIDNASTNPKTRKTKRANQPASKLGRSSESKPKALNRNRSLNTNNVHVRINRSLSGKVRNFYKGCNLTENYLFCEKGKSESRSQRSSVKEQNFCRVSAKAPRDKGFGAGLVKGNAGVLGREIENRTFLENLGKVYFKKLLEISGRKVIKGIQGGPGLNLSENVKRGLASRLQAKTFETVGDKSGNYLKRGHPARIAKNASVNNRCGVDRKPTSETANLATSKGHTGIVNNYLGLKPDGKKKYKINSPQADQSCREKIFQKLQKPINSNPKPRRRTSYRVTPSLLTPPPPPSLTPPHPTPPSTPLQPTPSLYISININLQPPTPVPKTPLSPPTYQDQFHN